MEVRLQISQKSYLLDSKEEEVMAKVEEIQESNQERSKRSQEGSKGEVTIDDFAKLDLRVGKVLSCEKHPDADSC